MKKTLPLLITLFLLAALFTSCTIFAPEPTSTPTLTATATQTASPTVTLTPTTTFTPTLEPTPTITNTSTPTPSPLNEIMNDMDLLGSYYPDTVTIEISEDFVPIGFHFPGYAVNMPPKMYTLTLLNNKTNHFSLLGTDLDSNHSLEIHGFFKEKDYVFDPLAFGTDRAFEMTTDPPDGEIVHRTDVSIISIDGKEAARVVYHIEEIETHIKIVMVGFFTLEEFSTDNNIIFLYFISSTVDSFDHVEPVSAELTDALTEMHAGYHKITPYGGIEIAMLLRDILTGVCPTETDPTYGYTPENPIHMYMPVEDQSTGRFYLPNIFQVLLYGGEPISWNLVEIVDHEGTPIYQYKVTNANLPGGTMLFFDFSQPEPFRVPSGFGCTGLIEPDHLLSFEPLKD